MQRLALTIALMTTLACGSDDPAAAGDGTARVLVLGTDFATTGIVSTIDIPSLEVTQNAIDGVASTDPVVRAIGDRLFIVNRFGADNVTIIDRDSLTLVEQVSTGNGSNPQDVEVVGDNLYVAALHTPGVLVFDINDVAAGPTRTIDLSALDATDGVPNCTTLRELGGALYVACGILDDADDFLTPRGAGKIAVIDPINNTVRAVIAMQNPNPFGFMNAVGSDLVLATVPSFADLTAGCIERIDAASQTSTCLVDNLELNGYASSIAAVDAVDAVDDSSMLISVTESFHETDFGPVGYLTQYSIATGQMTAKMTPSEQRPFDAVSCPTGHIAIADAAGGVRIYDGATELTDDPLDIGLPPVSKGLTCWSPPAL